MYSYVTVEELIALLQRDNALPKPKGWAILNPLRWWAYYQRQRSIAQGAEIWCDLLDDCNTDEGAEKLLKEFCETWEGFYGVNYIPHPNDSSTDCNGLSYASTTDTYRSTLWWDSGKMEWDIGDCGSWFEAIEGDAFDEAFDDWVAKDFEQALKNRLNLWEIWEQGSEWRDLFNKCCSLAESYPCVETSGQGFFVETEKIAAVATIAMLDRYGVDYETNEEEDE